MHIHNTAPFGSFTIFGLTQRLEGILQHRLQEFFGIIPRTIHLGDAGHLFLYTSSGEVAETETAIALKLGFVRTPDLEPISARQLLSRKILHPRMINSDEFRGNALVVCFSKTEPIFSAYQTLLSLPQLYYSVVGSEILCSDNLRCLVHLLEATQINQDIIPLHVLFGCAPGPLTYFENVIRLPPGHLLLWHEKGATVRHVQDFNFADRTSAFISADSKAAAVLCERLETVISVYLAEIQESGHDIGNLLSGGIDSSVIQVILSKQLPDRPQSFSYAMRTPGFEFEVEYAREASRALKTNHTFVEVFPKDFPDLLTRTIDLAAQPAFSEAEPCKLALAEFLSSDRDAPAFFFQGLGADQLFGLPVARKLAILDHLKRIPGSRSFLKAASFLSPSHSNKGHALREIANWLVEINKPFSFELPPATALSGQNLETLHRCFGPKDLERAITFRNSLQAHYLDSPHLIEKSHVSMLLINAYEPAVLGRQLFLANNLDQVYPYLDEDIIRAAFAYAPNVRYLKHKLGFLSRNCVKPLPRQILRQKAPSIVTSKPKGGSIFPDDLFDMMKHGSLQPLIQAIERPSFMGRGDFDQVLKQPSELLWNLLTFDIFQEFVSGLNQSRHSYEHQPVPAFRLA